MIKNIFYFVYRSPCIHQNISASGVIYDWPKTFSIWKGWPLRLKCIFFKTKVVIISVSRVFYIHLWRPILWLDLNVFPQVGQSYESPVRWVSKCLLMLPLWLIVLLQTVHLYVLSASWTINSWNFSLTSELQASNDSLLATFNDLSCSFTIFGFVGKLSSKSLYGFNIFSCSLSYRFSIFGES